MEKRDILITSFRGIRVHSKSPSLRQRTRFRCLNIMVKAYEKQLFM